MDEERSRGPGRAPRSGRPMTDGRRNSGPPDGRPAGTASREPGGRGDTRQPGGHLSTRPGDTGHAADAPEMTDGSLWDHKGATRIFKPESMRIHRSVKATGVTPEGVKALDPDGE